MRIGVLFLTALVLFGCADSKEVNAAFSRTQVSWALFDPASTTGLRALSGFAQGVKVTWVPRDQAQFVTDSLPLADHRGVLAVSHLGLLILDDSTGALVSFRPGAQFPMNSYETDRAFEWNNRIFVTLRQEFPADQPPASLAWWSAGQERLAFYPIPSQVKDPSRQAVGFSLSPGMVQMTWKVPQAGGWTFEKTTLTLADGSETLTEPAPEASPVPDKRYDSLRLRLSQRLGSGVPVFAAKGGPLLMFTASGWVAVGRPGEAARLYRLPELGEAGRYTAAMALDKGFVFVWEMAYRGYAGAAGTVHVPFAVLAP